MPLPSTTLNPFLSGWPKLEFQAVSELNSLAGVSLVDPRLFFTESLIRRVNAAVVRAFCRVENPAAAVSTGFS